MLAVPTIFEIFHNLNPNLINSADPNGVLPGFTDDEIYAGGPIEEAGVAGADTSQDWAFPGTNW